MRLMIPTFNAENPGFYPFQRNFIFILFIFTRNFHIYHRDGTGFLIQREERGILPQSTVE